MTLVLSNSFANAQVSIAESFSELESLKIDGHNDGLSHSIKFESRNSIVYNEPLDLPYQYLEDGKYSVGTPTVKLIETRLRENTTKTHFITFGPIDGFAVGFTIFESTIPHKIIGQIYSRQIVVPGNGFIYSIERENMNFFVKKKYKIEEGAITEIEQPFYGVDLESYTLNPVTIYKDEELTQPIATIPKNGRIKILIAKDPSEATTLYLVQTSFGLVGWAKLRSDQYRSYDVEGLSNHGG